MCAIFSGRMCTSQNSTIPPIGTKMMMNQARYIAALSINSGGRNDACALGARKRPATASTQAPGAAPGAGCGVRLPSDLPSCSRRDRSGAELAVADTSILLLL
ncbi:MAG: hypothetical protein IPI27_13120 [Betaproteobacteria bacterium]|nr:hypothetical protein [Betaproteobacteria bacterium]